MNDSAWVRIEATIANKSAFLDLDGIGLLALELPVDKLKSIEILNLRNNALTTLPENIHKLSNLKQILLDGNEISELPNSFCRLPSITNISLRGNDLVYLPENIGKLKKLNQFILSENQLSTLPDSICELIYLTSIDLSDNRLIGLPDDFGNIKYLNNLNLNRNQLVELPESIGDFEFLLNLNLSENNIYKLPGTFTNLKRINDLDLSGNRLKYLPEDIGNMLSIRDLQLNFNEIISLPESISEMKNLSNLGISNNRIEYLPNGIGSMRSLSRVNLSFNKLKKLPNDFWLSRRWFFLNVSHNKLENLPDSIGKYSSFRELDLSYNKLTGLPSSFVNLKKLVSLNIRNNKLEEFPDVLSDLNSDRLMLDYRENPFLERALMRSQKFTKIWKGTPNHLRELLKIYLSGFNVFFAQRTHQQIEFNVNNEPDGLAFEVVPNEDTDPNQVESLLNEYFDILKTKLKEGTRTGFVYPMSSDDPANLFAQLQASAFAVNATTIKHSVKGHVSDQDVIIGVSKSVDDMQVEFHTAIAINNKLNRELQEYKIAHSHLIGKSVAQQEEIEARRLESQSRASLPTTINIQQQVLIKQEIGNDFAKLRELLFPLLSEYQRQEGASLQSELDKASEKPTLVPEEKKSLGKKIKRWVEGAKEAVKVGKEAGEVGGEVIKYWDKLKDFAESVLNDPDLVETIQQAVDGLA
ncbi:leucine-rich repeat domain-containing protein [Spirosoma litoris]